MSFANNYKLKDNQEIMQEYLGYDLPELEYRGALHTAKEISNQPELWLKTWDLVVHYQASLTKFLKKIYAHETLDIIIAGAGTSAFIGNILQGTFKRNTGKSTYAIATTDLVSHPDDYLRPEHPTLLISFARSGNSPESIAAVNLVNTHCSKVYHLIITCNPSGQLAINKYDKNTFIFLLPPESNDLGLAMTGSFTSMLLTGLLISQIERLEALKNQVEQLAAYGEKIIFNYSSPLQKAATLDFQRAIFLGSGPLLGTARESQLKLQELTDGKVICNYDSFLGLRHGPQAVINSHTLLVYLFSNREYVHPYEVDLIKTINKGEKGLFQIGVTESPQKDLKLDLMLELSSGNEKIEEEFLSVCSVLPAQILGFYKSLHLGLKPDSPSVNGAISRVVQGVTIYPYHSPSPPEA